MKRPVYGITVTSRLRVSALNAILNGTYQATMDFICKIHNLHLLSTEFIVVYVFLRCNIF